MIKLFHTADLHLDTPFSAMNDLEKARLRRRELRESLFSMVDWAKEREVDLFLCAGDMADGTLYSPSGWRAVAAKMESAPNIRFFIAPGNHDPAEARSIWRLLDFPKNVHVFLGGMERVELAELNLDVYGAAFTTEFMEEPVLSGFRVVDPSRMNIMVLHGEVTGGRSRYNPIDPAHIEKSGLDYLALGHVHAHSGVMRAGGTLYCYPGAPEPRGFDETGKKGFIEVTGEKGGLNPVFVPWARRQYVELSADITGADGEDALIARAAEVLSEVGEEHIVRLTLTGERESGLVVGTGDIERAFSGRFYLKVEDATRPGRDIALIGREQSLKGAFVRNIEEKLRAAQDDGERRTLSMALSLGLAALSGEDIAL